MREPPVPMLAHVERTLPRGVHWRYEPKLDAFRGLLWHGDGPTDQLLSRNVKDLSAWFPEVVQAGNALPSNTLLDGEIVIADDGGCSDFGALHLVSARPGEMSPGLPHNVRLCCCASTYSRLLARI